MNSDFLKREKIREAIANRLLQLTKQCEEVCDSSFSSRGASDETNLFEKQDVDDNYEKTVFNIKIPTYTQKPSVSPSPEVLAVSEDNLTKPPSPVHIMVNNFVSPVSDVESLTKPKAFTKDVLPLNNSTRGSSEADPSETLFIRTMPKDNIPLSTLENNSVSPNSKASRSDCGSRLLTSTPSTDLERYMDSSADTLKSTSIMDSDSDLSLSDDSPESQADHVTVVSLTSGTETPPSEIVSRVLNELPNTEEDQKHADNHSLPQTPDQKNTSRRRLSYTLECPSPVLEKAMKDHPVGPDAIISPRKGELCPKNPEMQCNLSVLNTQTKHSYRRHSLEEQFRTPTPPISKIPVLNSQASKSPSPLYNKDHLFQTKKDVKTQPHLQHFKGTPNKPFSPDSKKHFQPQKKDYSSTSFTRRRWRTGAYSQDWTGADKDRRVQPSGQLSVSVLDQQMKFLQAEVISLRQECAQYHHLFELQSQKLNQISGQQEQFFKQILKVNSQQMVKLKKELSLELRSLFLQQTQTMQQTFFRSQAPSFPREPPLVPFPGPESLSSSDVVDSLTAERMMSPEIKPKFDRLTATVKGYLTRRLLKTEKVNGLIQTIKDTMECAIKLHDNAMTRNERITSEDAELHQRLINQVTAACSEFHDVFFKYSIQDRMLLISQSRQLARDKTLKVPHYQNPKPFISAATLKSLERKKNEKCKSASPTIERRKWKEFRRSSTVADFHSNSHTPPKILPTQVTARKSLQSNDANFLNGDCRSPSFLM